MDFLRSCNVLRTRVYDGSGQETWLRWYITAPDAPAYPHPHSFGHPVWETSRDEFDGPGCFYHPLLWRPNAYPARPTYTPIGTPEDFRLGLIPGEPPVEPVPCGGPGIVSAGGVCGCGTAWSPRISHAGGPVAGSVPGLLAPVRPTYLAASSTVGGGSPGGAAHACAGAYSALHFSTAYDTCRPSAQRSSSVAGGGGPADTHQVHTGAYDPGDYSDAWDTFR